MSNTKELGFSNLEEISKMNMDEISKEIESPDKDDKENNEDSGIYTDSFFSKLEIASDDTKNKELTEKTTEQKISNNDVSDKTTMTLTHEQIIEKLSDIDNEKDREGLSKLLEKELLEYQKKIMVDFGLSEAESYKAVEKRLEQRAVEITEKYHRDHPDVVITIDKQNADKVEFTEEEKNKLTVSKSIRLITVEDKELKTLKVGKIPKKIDKVSFLRNLDAALSSFKIPLPIMGDYVQFTGAQSIQMATVFSDDDNDDIVDSIRKRAELCYDKFYGSASLKKYDEKNNVVLTYTDFINSVPYNDLDMMLYAVYCASTPENQELPMICRNKTCGNKYEWTINAKTLLQTEELPEWCRERINKIMNNIGKIDKLQELSSDWKSETRYESPYTKNIYSISQPTIAKYIEVFTNIDKDDPVAIYNGLFISMIDSLFIRLDQPDENGNEYIQISYDEDDFEILKEAVSQIPDKDLKIILKVIADMSYLKNINYGSETELSLPLKFFPKCPHCGQTSINSLSIRHLVFLKAQDLSEEMM